MKSTTPATFAALLLTVKTAILGTATMITGTIATATADAVEPDTECAEPSSVSPHPAPAATENPERAHAHQLATGRGVKVAVIDTGVAPHEQLGNMVAGADLVTPEEPNPLWDCDMHGTAVAGIIASRDAGVAPGVEIVSIRQTSAHFRSASDRPTTTGNLETLAAALDDALSHGAAVINTSVVSCVPADVAPRVDTSALDEALARAEDAGAVVVSAAGNQGPGCAPGDVVYPAHLPTVLSVGAVGNPDEHVMAEYSLPASPVGPAPDNALAGNGEHPAALAPEAAGWAPGEEFIGTSFAAPLVSGALALLKERNPEASPAELRALVHQQADPTTGYVDPYRVVMAHAADYAEAPREATITVPAATAPKGPRYLRLLSTGVAGAVSLSLVIIALVPRRGRRR